jgi:hypothetical protein
MLLSKLTFVSLLTEGINTVIPLFEDEVYAFYDVVKSYLEDNFPELETNLDYNKEESRIDVLHSASNELYYTISIEDARILILKDSDVINLDISSSLYGILTTMSTLLIARLNNFSFKSTQLEDIVSEDISNTDLEETEAEQEVPTYQAEEDEEEESSFEDDWI